MAASNASLEVFNSVLVVGEVARVPVCATGSGGNLEAAPDSTIIDRVQALHAQTSEVGESAPQVFLLFNRESWHTVLGHLPSCQAIACILPSGNIERERERERTERARENRESERERRE